MQQKIRALVDSRTFQNLIIALIVVNAVILGAQTLPVGGPDRAGPVLAALDLAILYAFATEIALRLYAYRASYFKSGWNLFDFVIVAASFLAASSGLAAIRALRVLRVLRVVTVIPRMRVVVSALLDSIPGIASVGVVIVLILYVFAVIAANLYGPAHPALFGDVFSAMYTLFQVMTLEGWPDVARQLSETHPRSWVFFVSFLLIATFTMLNLFVAIVVRVVEEDSANLLEATLREELSSVRAEIERLRKALEER